MFCVAEDRPFAETGLRLLLLSLADFGGATATVLHRPDASPEFAAWCRQFPWLEIAVGALGGCGLLGWFLQQPLLLKKASGLLFVVLTFTAPVAERRVEQVLVHWSLIAR